MNRAEQIAVALIEIIDRGRTSGRPGAELDLAAVLADALDSYELARLHAVASSALGRPSSPDPHRYCPWCQAEFKESGFAEHLQAAHARMLEA